MAQLTFLLPKSYFTAFSKVAKDTFNMDVVEWTETDNNCCQITVDGINDIGELLMIGIKIGIDEVRKVQKPYDDKIDDSVKSILDNALKQLEP